MQLSKSLRKALKRIVKQSRQYDDTLAYRQKIKQHIDSVVVNGSVKIVESGMDCDCVRYSGLATVISANVMSVIQELDRIYNNAEGPVSIDIVSPDAEVVYTTRDLALEAHEDQHSHVVYC